MGMLTDEQLKTIKVGDTIKCRPIHLRGGNSTRNRKVRAVNSSPYGWQHSGIAVNAHGYNEFWLKKSEIISIENLAV